MAVVQLSDVIVPEFYAEYGGFDSMTSTALYASGILEQNPILFRFQRRLHQDLDGKRNYS
jgi:hypothetical protein